MDIGGALWTQHYHCFSHQTAPIFVKVAVVNQSRGEEFRGSMEIKDKVIVITGGASGIGRALAERCTAEKARQVIIADLDADALANVAQNIGARAIPTDVANEDDIKR